MIIDDTFSPGNQPRQTAIAVHIAVEIDVAVGNIFAEGIFNPKRKKIENDTRITQIDTTVAYLLSFLTIAISN